MEPDGRWIIFPGKILSLSHDLLTLIWDVENDTFDIFMNEFVTVCWSPDGEKIGVVPADRSKLTIMDFYTQNTVKEFIFADTSVVGTRLDWSNDGKWILLGFNSEELLHILNYMTGDILVARFDNIERCWYPSWSSDGRKIVFEARLPEDTWSTLWCFEFPEELLNVR